MDKFAQNTFDLRAIPCHVSTRVHCSRNKRPFLPRWGDALSQSVVVACHSNLS
jgi:hypothetical protein